MIKKSDNKVFHHYSTSIIRTMIQFRRERVCAVKKGAISRGGVVQRTIRLWFLWPPLSHLHFYRQKIGLYSYNFIVPAQIVVVVSSF